MSIFLKIIYTVLLACFIFASLDAAAKESDEPESTDLRVSLIITSKDQEYSNECTIERRVKGNNTSLTVKSRTPIESTNRSKLIRTILHVDKITEDLLGENLEKYCEEKAVLTSEKSTSTKDDSDCQKDSIPSSPKPTPNDVVDEIEKQSGYSIYKWIIPIGGAVALLAFNWAKIMSLRKCS